MDGKKQADYVVIGAGIVGLSIARELRSQFPNKKIIVLEKEPRLAMHGSGRNSGVLHAGFYYPSESLKAQFCREGNAAMKEYVRSKNLQLLENGKLVVAKDILDLKSLQELKKRGEENGCNVKLVDMKEAAAIEPQAKTYQRALWSPDTATIDPVEVVHALADDLRAAKVEIMLGEAFVKREGKNAVVTTNHRIEYHMVINAAGLYADRIAHAYGYGEDYTIIPFKGIYLKRDSLTPFLRTHVYPVPNLKNPFLGVHFTVTVDGKTKIGPTAIPALWRENYQGKENFDFKEMAQILGWEAKLFLTNAFGFRDLAFEEIKKYKQEHLIALAGQLVHKMPEGEFTTWGTPGIRAQLLHKSTHTLEQDFVIEGDRESLHILNAVSPAFTCAFPFAKWVVGKSVLLSVL